MFSRKGYKISLLVCLVGFVHSCLLAELGYFPVLPPAVKISTLERVTRPVVGSARQSAAAVMSKEANSTGDPPPATGQSEEPDVVVAPYFLGGGAVSADSHCYEGAMPLDGEGSERFPASWALPPGSSIPGGHPGYRREVASLDYSESPGVAYFPPPVYDSASSGPVYSYPSSEGYYGGGPFGYEFGGINPYGPALSQSEFSYEYSTGLPFSRSFDAESAHLKMGPVYFRAVAVEAGLLYSDYHGPETFAPGEEDGWLSFAGFGFQLSARLAPSLYLSAQGELIYLFGENELGIRSGLGAGGPFARLANEGIYGSWEVTLFAEAGTGSFFHEAFGADAYDRAGRYSFGFLGYEDRERLLYDPFLYTRVGAEATTPTSQDWRLTLSADHSDFWYLGDDRDDRHHSQDHLGVLYSAEPGRIPFTPWFSYDLFAHDGFETVYNTVYTGGSGRLSQNVFLDGRVGYLWTTDDRSDNEHWLWQIGLRHRINERTTHGVRVGQDYFMSEFSTDSAVSNFVHYYLQHQISDRMSISGYTQFSSDEYLSGTLAGGTFDREMYGVQLSATLSDRISGSVGYRLEHSSDEATNRDDDRSIFDANLNMELGARTSAYLRYQHEDTDLYYEDLYMSGIRRRF